MIKKPINNTEANPQTKPIEQVTPQPDRPKRIEDVIKDPEVVKILKAYENQSQVDDDEFTFDPFTGSKTFKLDENGCRKGWTWDYELGRCVPIDSIRKSARTGIDNTNPQKTRTVLINKQLQNQAKNENK